MKLETPKQNLRRLLDRLKSLTPEQVREIDKQIEDMPDDEAEMLVSSLDEFERMRPGTIEEFIDEINRNGIPPDD